MQRYSVRDQLGQGNYGCVRVAIENKTGRVFAMKRVSKSNLKWISKTGAGLIPMEVAVMSTLREVKTVVCLHEYFQDDNYVYIVMEKPIGSIDLQHYLYQENCLTEEVAVNIFGQLAKTLYKMHQLGVVHGDLKLQNVLINPSTLKVHLIDFGQSYFLSQKKDVTWESFTGTPSYAPPEMICSGKMNIQQAEVWSLGILLYTLVTGRKPFATDEEITLKGLHLPASVSDDLKQLLLALLNKWPCKRYTLVQTVKAAKLLEDVRTYHVVYTPTGGNARFKEWGYSKELRCRDCWKLAPMFSMACLQRGDAYVVCFYCKASLRNTSFNVTKHRQVCAKRPTKYSACKTYCVCQ